MVHNYSLEKEDIHSTESNRWLWEHEGSGRVGWMQRQEDLGAFQGKVENVHCTSTMEIPWNL